MKSPFPGMDPYLEAHWPSVHTHLVARAGDALNGTLPSDLAATVEERIAVETESDDPDDSPRLLRYGPDVSIREQRGQGVHPSPQSSEAVATLELPYRLVISEPLTERFIRIIEIGTERLITVIEFLSPANKVGEGMRAYKSKRQDLLASGVSIVEIDLIRRGNWRELLRPTHFDDRPGSTYRATIRRADESEAVYVYPLPLRKPLRSLPIPLRPHDPEVKLDLQPLLDATYTNGRYPQRLDYTRPLITPLDPPDAAWTEDVLKSWKRES